MPEDMLLIGYRLDDALQKLPRDKEVIIKEVIIEVTKAPSKDGKNETDCLKPVIIKHVESGKRVVLTVSCFK